MCVYVHTYMYIFTQLHSANASYKLISIIPSDDM